MEDILKALGNLTNTQGVVQNALLYIGIAKTFHLCWSAVGFASRRAYSSSLPRYHHGKPGSTWALVTGASDGIGLGFAEELCERGFNVLLHGRNQQKLEGVQRRLQSIYPNVEIRCVVADASKIDADIEGIRAATSSLPGKLTVLINNVGGQPYEPTYGALDEVSRDYVDWGINLNARFPAQLTRVLIPTLKSNTPSAIMNIGSATGLQGLPFLATYSACKAFNLRFTEGLKLEFQATKVEIEVIGLLVSSVATTSSGISESAFSCSPRYLAKCALAKMGCGQTLAWAWWRHALQWSFTEYLPQALLEQFVTDQVLLLKAQKEKGN